MFGFAYVSLKGISPVETDAQDIAAEAVETMNLLL